MADITPSKTHPDAVETSRKRTLVDAGAGAGDVERRKKRKRTPHSKRKGDEDSIRSQDVELATSADRSTGGAESSGNPSKENDNSSKLKNPGVKVDQSESTKTTIPKSSEDTSKKSKEKKKEKKRKISLELVPTPFPDKIDDDIDTKSGKKKYPDPSKDTELSGSALKEWKFNKARQNWLLRNLWDTTIIPDPYFPSCVKYLKGVQGNSRNVLVKECNTILEEHSKASVGESAQAAGTVRFQEPEESKRPIDAKLPRAKIILAKLGDKPKG